MTTNIKHSSETNEHFSPPIVVKASRTLLGDIDLDPASSLAANKHLIHAKRIFEVEDNGFTRRWRGRVFLNPPGGFCDIKGRRVIKVQGKRQACIHTGDCGQPPGHTHVGCQSSSKVWWFKLAKEWMDGRVESAVFLGFSIEILQTTQMGSGDLPIPLDFPLCFPATRIHFFRYLPLIGDFEKSRNPPHANVIIYLPPMNTGGIHEEKFHNTFSMIGRTIWPSPRSSCW